MGYIFSGSAVIDHDNTSGLGTKENPAMVAIYTYHDPVGEKEKRMDFQTQGIAYSTDKGRTWTKHVNNPVLKNPGIKDFRDPKVSWLEGKDGSGKWVMSLAVLDRISFYSSPNLLDWSLESDFNPDWAAYGGVWECPDLFQMKAADGTEKWILFVSINPGGPNGGSATQYFVGDFDGKTFLPEHDAVKWLDYGADNYAGVTWSNVPEQDGRRLFIGWMSNWDYAQVVPTHPWRSAMTLPRNLELVKIGDGYEVASRPVAELESLRKSTKKITSGSVDLEEELVEVELVPKVESDFEIEFSNAMGEKVTFKKSGDSLVFDRTSSGLVDFEARFAKIHTAPLNGLEVKSLRIFVDSSSIEIFVNDGEMVMTELVFPTEPYTKLDLKGFERENTVHYLKSIW
jgi:fructan beta-fructosidase